MSLPSKLTLQKTRIKYLTVALGASAVLAALILSDWSSCGIDHVSIIVDTEQYRETLDPEFCEELVYRIDNFNAQCPQTIEILDCG